MAIVDFWSGGGNEDQAVRVSNGTFTKAGGQSIDDSIRRLADRLPKCKYDATTAPTTTDDSASNYAVGSRWIDVTNDRSYICVDSTASAAVWRESSPSGLNKVEVSSGTISEDPDSNSGGKATGSGSTITSTAGTGSLAHGYASSGGDILCSGLGSTALGYAGQGTIEATGHGSLAWGMSSTNANYIRAAGSGSCAFGYIQYSYGSGTIRANGAGALAHGSRATGTIIASGIGSHAHGYCGTGAGGNIEATASGAIAAGLSDGSYVKATGNGSMAIGHATSAILASAASSFQLGVGTNSQALSLQVGNTTNGVRLNGNGAPGTPHNGDIWVDGSGNIVLRTAGDSRVIYPVAASKTIERFYPNKNEAPTSNAATLDTRNVHPVLDFDDTTNESAVWTGIISEGYAGENIDVVLHVSFTTATSGDSDWDVAWERIGSGSQDVDSDGFATAVSTDNTTVPATSGHVQQITVTFTQAQADAIAAGELYRIKVTRDAASDTATGDAELHAVHVRLS